MSDPSSNHYNLQKHTQRTLIGLIPAAGKGARLNPLPFSKELYPIGFHWTKNPQNIHPKPICVYLMEKMRLAGVENAYVVLRNGKWDIPAFLADGKMLDMHLAYLMMDLPYGVPYTLDQAYTFVHSATIVFGFPDILFYPNDAFLKLLSKQYESQADIVLGLFPVSQKSRMDMVELDGKGRIRQIHIKPNETNLFYTWIIASWTPTFTDFMHKYVSTIQKENDFGKKYKEICFSDVMNDAIKNDVQIECVIFDKGHCLDIGTPENLVVAVRMP